MAIVVSLGVSISPAAHARTGPPSGDVVTYRPPVEAPVSDGFRPPAHVGGPGNRGLEYATRPGSAVRAAAPGSVTFAGRVGAGLHITVAHPDGVRTSYSFLRTIAVRAHERVARGQVLGTSGASFHFGARLGDVYVDPAVLIGTARPARLVPVARFGATPLPRHAKAPRAAGHPVREWSAVAAR